MSVTVTLHVYSGRPDPSWELSENEAQEFANRLAAIQSTTRLKPAGMTAGLGYRGFSVSSVREPLFDPLIYLHGGVIDRDRFVINLIEGNPSLEKWLLDTGGVNVPDSVRATVSPLLDDSVLHPQTPVVTMPLAVPPFNPGKWNNDTSIRTRNNCYNYANDKITNTFAQPGRGSGTIFTALACPDVTAAASRDGQRTTGVPSTTPAQGHFIALVSWPDEDYHWYRLDADGRWSHKPGQTAATNLDNSGNLISDPRACNRGPYSDFCGFFHCIPVETRIR